MYGHCFHRRFWRNAAVGHAQQLPTTQAGSLTGQQINALVNGKKLSWLNEYQKPVSAKLNPDGTLNGSAVSADNGIQMVYDNGWWRIIDNTLCVKMAFWLNGKELCRGIFFEAGAYHWADATRKALTISQ
jgi:hypothetical protein